MQLKNVINRLTSKAASGNFVSFTYTKDTGETSKRVVRLGGDIEKRLEKEGTPINGKGSWMTGHTHNKNGFLVSRNGRHYLRGTEVNRDGEITGKHKLFCIDGISRLK